MPHKLFEAAWKNAALIEDETQHSWIFNYGLTNRDLSKSLQNLKSILRGVLLAHSTEKVFKIQFKDLQGALGAADGKNIYLNVNIFTKVPQEHLVSVFSAVALHEYFHVLYTDWKSKYLDSRNLNYCQQLWQFVEDTKIEVIGKANNFSCEDCFSLLMRDIAYKTFDNFKLDVDASRLINALGIVCKWVRIPQLLTDEEKDFEIADGVKLLNELERSVPNYHPLEPKFSTDAVVDAIKEILDKLQEESPAEEESKDDSEDNGEGNQKPQEDNEDDSEEDANNEKPDQQRFDEIMKEINDFVSAPTDAKLKKLIVSIIELSNNPIDLTAIQHKGLMYVSPNELPGGSTPPKFINCKAVKCEDAASIQSFKKDYNAVKHGIQAMRSRFLIRHSEISTDIREQEHGKLDKRRLYRASYDDLIFRKTETIKTVGMDVALLLDSSGSMSAYSRMEQCRRCGILMAEAFRGIPGLSLTIYSHTTGDVSDTCEITSLYGDLANQDIKNLGVLTPKNGTYDGFAIKFVGKRLLNNDNGNEKWLINVSDGEPCAQGYGGEDGITHTARVVKGLSKQGVNIIGVDIGNMPQFKQMFPRSVAFTDVRKLVSNMGKLVSRLVKNRSVEIHCE